MDGRQTILRLMLFIATVLILLMTVPENVFAQEGTSETATIPDGPLKLSDLVQAGGPVGIVILGLSIAMVALIVEHTLSIRRSTMLPDGLDERVQHLIRENHLREAQICARDNDSFLGRVLDAGLEEAGIGYTQVEKAMEDSVASQSARLMRKIEYLSVIGTIAPMLGLLGTVWGMIQAFMEFETKANPQVAELAPGIYRALITTLLGLGVAVPALAGFAIFRNRIDGLVDDGVQMADRVFSELRRAAVARKRAGRRMQSERSAPVNDVASVENPTNAGGIPAISETEEMP